MGVEEMGTNTLNQWTILETTTDDYILTWLEAFITDRKVQNLSKGTVRFYVEKLKLFAQYCDLESVFRVRQITPDIIRGYLVYLQEKDHNPGGIHAAYRTLRTFLYWWEQETEPDGWKNPIKKVRAPKLAVEPLEPVSIDIVRKLIETCEEKTLLALRDKALLVFLLDTGARASEVCAVNLEDIDLVSGSIEIRCGKGRKPRIVFLGQKGRRALRAYLKLRNREGSWDGKTPCWINKDGERLTYWGLNEIIRRRARVANVGKPELHDFRRAFAINFLRNGGDVYSLQKLMGHADLQVLRRYLAQTNEDMRIAHQKFSPVDRGI